MSQDAGNPLPQAEAWDGIKELRRLIGKNVELAAVYARLGYSVFADCESERLLKKLRALIGVEVVDFDAFRGILLDIENKRSAGLSAAEVDFFNEIGPEAVSPERLKAFLNRDAFVLRRAWEFGTSVRRHVTDSSRFGILLEPIAKPFARRS